MADEEHIAALRDACRALNKAIDSAVNDDLEVDISTFSTRLIQDRFDRITVTGTVRRYHTHEQF